eukprot:4667586-Prymnesium_polylepis.1
MYRQARRGPRAHGPLWFLQHAAGGGCDCMWLLAAALKSPLCLHHSFFVAPGSLCLRCWTWTRSCAIFSCRSRPAACGT